MSVFDDALEIWSGGLRQSAEETEAAFERFFGEKPELVDNTILAKGALLSYFGGNRWYLDGSCPVCGQEFSRKLLVSESRNAAMQSLGQALYAWRLWRAQHRCISDVDYGMLDRSLEYAAGKAESGSACEAELALGLVIAQALVAIAKEIGKHEDR